MAFLQNNYIHKQYELTTNLTFFLSKHNSRSYHSGRDVVVPLFLQVNLRPFLSSNQTLSAVYIKLNCNIFDSNRR